MEKHKVSIQADRPADQQNPESLIRKVINTSAFQNFFNTISNGGFLLLAAAIAAFIWSNIDAHSYHDFWHIEVRLTLGAYELSHSLAHWVNDGLMTFFFFTVGLEIKREMLVGRLSDLRTAALPIAAAAGGMIFPALIYAVLNMGGYGLSGWGIPMATDIAFSLAILSTLGNRVPLGIRLFLTAFAIADDLGAILVIALFYTPQIHLDYLVAAALVCLCLFILNRLWVKVGVVYLIFGALLWFMVGHSGLHATITGVLVAAFIPARSRYDTSVFMRLVHERLEHIESESETGGHSVLTNPTHLEAVQAIHSACGRVETPLQRLEETLEPWIAYLVLPLFALANAGVVLGVLDLGAALSHPVTIGVGTGLALGKPIGVTLFTWLATRMLRVELIGGSSWQMIIGVGFLGGIGFTMSLFIAALSFTDPILQEYAKIGIIIGSLIGGLCGYFLLRFASYGRAQTLNSRPMGQ
ncbi:MAG: Na+/H+ antiporter NhaA [Desulfofustis sp. PB-SRB1]|nr:Na+/H+ antiporter NhaA [Desulfofustis sp. PB-SRB1]MBM1002630.1 Na+/H+ antiporter NhaA [Desulfofustis sp. PB-SRB1]